MREATPAPVSYTHLRAHETPEQLVCRLLLEKKKWSSGWPGCVAVGEHDDDLGPGSSLAADLEPGAHVGATASGEAGVDRPLDGGECVDSGVDGVDRDRGAAEGAQD